MEIQLPHEAALKTWRLWYDDFILLLSVTQGQLASSP